MIPSFVDPYIAHDTSWKRRWTALAGSVLLVCVSVCVIAINLVAAILGTGLDLWRWLTDYYYAEET